MLDFLRRNASGPFGLVLIILLVLAFSVWGIGDIFRNYDIGTIARIGDREVESQEFFFRFNRELNKVSSELERFVSPEEARESGLDYQILTNLILEKTINSSGDQMKLRPSNESLTKRIRNTNAFKNAFNQFDKNIFNQVIRQNGISEDLFIEMERDSLSQIEIYSALFNNFEPPKELNDLIYKFQYEDRNIEYVILNIDENSVNRSAITEADLEKYYQINKSSYKTEPLRSFSLISLLNSEIKNSIKVEESLIQEIYDNNIKDYESPEKRSYYLIPFSDEKSAEEALSNYKDGNDINNLIINRGLSIDDVRQESLSKDQGITNEISEIAFKTKMNDLTGPVEGPFGPSLIYLLSIEQSSKKSFNEAKDEITKEYKLNLTQDNIYNLYNVIEDQRAEGLTFEEIIKGNSLELNNYKSVNEEGMNFLNDKIELSTKNSILEIIFESNIEMEIEPFEDDSGNIFFIRIDNITDEKIIKFQDIIQEIKEDLIIERSKELLVVKSNNYLESIKNDSSNLQEIADELNVAILKGDNLSRYTFNEVFSREAISEIFKTQLAKPFISDVGIGNSIILGLISEIKIQEENTEKLDIVKNQNEERMKNELLIALSEELQSELKSEIFPERLDILFETVNSQGSF
jgi:peptidyl-prolyl cis-trans isomerase D